MPRESFSPRHRSLPFPTDWTQECSPSKWKEKQLAGLPSSFDPAFQIPANPRGDAIRAASDAIAPMFWGKRIPIDEACSTISAWIRRRLE
jgi:hypothetical protein